VTFGCDETASDCAAKWVPEIEPGRSDTTGQLGYRHRLEARSQDGADVFDARDRLVPTAAHG
jgi:hypothetical protein